MQHPLANPKVDAEPAVIAFDFQFYVFLSAMLHLKVGQSAAFEVGEDVWVKNGKDEYTLIQVKHSIDGSNLTELDSDFWKTVYNWSEIVENQSSKINFNKFILFTNKQIPESNTVIKSLEDYKNDIISYSDVIEKLCAIYDATKNITIKFYIGFFLSLAGEQLKKIIDNFEVCRSTNDIIPEVKKAIREHKIRRSRIDDVFYSTSGKFNELVYEKIRNKEKIIVEYDEVEGVLVPIMEHARAESLPIRQTLPDVPANPVDQHFIQELIKIGEVTEQNKKAIYRMTLEKLMLSNNLELWRTHKELRDEDIARFEDISFKLWSNCHKKNHRATNAAKELFGFEKIEKEQARACLDEVREIQLKMLTTDLGPDLSNGHFYLLADDAKIGWLLFWEDRYL